MIYTVTFNPSLDYVIKTNTLKLGAVNRTTEEHIYPGGKGINVSVMLSNMGIKNKAFGFKAGFTGNALEQMLKEFGCDTDFIPIANGASRINVKINAGAETEINGQGPEIPESAIETLYQKLDQLEKNDVLVLAGSIPKTLPETIYENILERLHGRGIHFVVDATGDLLLRVLKYKPFFVKPNHHELGELFGVTLKSNDEIVTYAKKLQELGAQHVLVSMAGDGAILVTKDGVIYQSAAPKGTVVNSVGAGDSMVAGFLAGFLNTGSLEKAFQLSLASGSASAFSSWLASSDDIAALLKANTH